MRTAFVLEEKTRQLRDLTLHTGRLSRELATERRCLQKLLTKKDLDDHHRFMLAHVQNHISWLETSIALFERQMDKLLTEDEKYPAANKSQCADKTLARKISAETGIDPQNSWL